MLYFVLKNDRKLGPFTESQLQELLSAGLISAVDRAWKVEESEGTPLDQMFAGEQNPAEEELDTVHSSPIAVSQGMRPQALEAVGASTSVPAMACLSAIHGAPSIRKIGRLY